MGSPWGRGLGRGGEGWPLRVSPPKSAGGSLLLGLCLPSFSNGIFSMRMENFLPFTSSKVYPGHFEKHPHSLKHISQLL